jgi:hypothetical protein
MCGARCAIVEQIQAGKFPEHIDVHTLQFLACGFHSVQYKASEAGPDCSF